MTDPRIEQYAAERADLATKVHKAMLSSYIGPPRPMLLGDADRAVAAVVTAGWRPGTVTPEEVEDAARQGYEQMFEGQLPGGIETDLWRNVARAIFLSAGLIVADVATPSRE